MPRGQPPTRLQRLRIWVADALGASVLILLLIDRGRDLVPIFLLLGLGLVIIYGDRVTKL
jgi:hypothetical protein